VAYTAPIVCGAGFVPIPEMPLLKIILISQVANGVLLPFVLVFMLLLKNRERLMGEYRNGFGANAIAWGTSIVMAGLTAVMIWNSLTG
jgi:Mn2+/Fe2+ NRAMP family transporter